jgi:hypothetical protein
MKLWFIRTDPVKRLRRILGDGPITIGSVAELLLAVRADTKIKESLEERIKRELLLGLNLDAWERDLLEAAPGSAVLISTAFAAIRAAVTDWQL